MLIYSLPPFILTISSLFQWSALPANSHPFVLPLLSVPPPSDQAFLQASIIFQQLREEKPVTHQHLHYERKTDTPPPEGGDRSTRRQAYQLAFNTLKCMIALSHSFDAMISFESAVDLHTVPVEDKRMVKHKEQKKLNWSTLLLPLRTFT